MADRANVLLGALKRLQRELSYYGDELNNLNTKLEAAKDESEVKKLEEMVSETKAVMSSTQDKIDAYTTELAEMGV